MATAVETIRENLQKLSDVFSGCAVECMEAFFGKKCETFQPWDVVESLQGRFDCIVSLFCASPGHSTLSLVGIQHDSLKALVGSDHFDADCATDTFGEYLNCYNGLLVRNESYRNTFGEIYPGLPMLYTNGYSLIPFLWGIHGYVYFGDHWIYVGFSVRDNLDQKK